MIILGIILLIVGLVVSPARICVPIGAVLIVVGLVLAVLNHGLVYY